MKRFNRTGISVWAGVAVAIVAASAGYAAPAPWIEVTSPHFTVITNAGERDGKQALWQFEQIRQALQIIWPWARIDGGRPLSIFAVRDEATLKTLGPQYWEGRQYRPTSFWVSGADREYVALRTDLPLPDEVGENPYQSAYWNYVSLVFHRSMPGRVPYWYARGLSEVMSNTLVREKEIHVGRLIRNRLQSARESPLVPAAEFFTADGRSKYGRNEVDAWQFDSQAWALVHYLMFANRGEHGARVNRLNRLLFEGVEPGVAVKEAFGPDMTPYIVGMREYIRREVFQFARVPVAVGVQAEAFTSRPLAPPEAAIERARLLVAMGRPAEARAFAAEAAKADPQHPGPSEVEGLLAEDAQDKTAARTAYQKAADLGSKRAATYYRLARLLRPETTPDRETSLKLASLLDRALTLDSNLGEAASMLADVRSDLDEPEAAVELARRGVKLRPGESYPLLTLARALWNSRLPDDALAAARQALAVADSDEERTYAQRFLDFAARAPRPSVPAAATKSAPPVASPSPPADGAGQAAVPMRLDGPSGAVRVADDVSACVNSNDNAACRRAAPAIENECRAGTASACRLLGSLYDGGFGVALDKMLAGRFYRAGCDKGDAPSCARFAVLSVQGAGVQRDSAGGYAVLEKLCGEKVDDACIGLAILISERPQNRDVPRARALLDASCAAGNPEACRIRKTLPPR